MQQHDSHDRGTYMFYGARLVFMAVLDHRGSEEMGLAILGWLIALTAVSIQTARDHKQTRNRRELAFRILALVLFGATDIRMLIAMLIYETAGAVMCNYSPGDTVGLPNGFFAILVVLCEWEAHLQSSLTTCLSIAILVAFMVREHRRAAVIRTALNAAEDAANEVMRPSIQEPLKEDDRNCVLIDKSRVHRRDQCVRGCCATM